LEDAEKYWNAFWFLNPSRNSAFDIGAIPLVEIVAYFKEVSWTNDLEQATSLIRTMDTEFMDLVKEKVPD
jgi:hypothetical protein